MSNRGVPWYKGVRRWGQTNLTEDDPIKCDLSFWRKQWKETRIQGVIVNCGGIVSYYQSRYKLQYRARYLGERDFFKEFSDAAREEGLAVVARMDINRATKEFFEHHPDWFCRDKNGNPIMAGDRYISCVNGGYYKEFIPQVLTEIIEKYRPDGFADNSWKGMGQRTICYCDNCREKFKKDCGLELPEKVDWDDQVYRQWVRWGYQNRIDNWDLFNETTRRVGGEDCLWVGMINGDPIGSSEAFADLKALCSRSRIIFCDHQSRDDLHGFEQNSLNGALLRMAAEENTLVPESCANYVRGSRTFRLAANPWQETHMWMVEGAAGGISPWYHHVGGGQNDRRQFETPIPFFQWHAKYEDYLYDRKSLANVGIVWSQENIDFYGRDEKLERVGYPWIGFCRALSKGHIPFLPIHVEDLERYRDRIETLILPNLAILSDRAIEEILKFLDEGGSLVMTGITGTLTEDGNPSENDTLWKRIGITLTGERVGAFGRQSSDWSNQTAHNYFRLPDERHEIWKGFEKTDIFPFGGGLYIAQSDGLLKPLASYIPAFPIYPPEFSWIREERPDISVLFAGELPNGSRIVYFPADIDRCYGKHLLPDHGKLLVNAVRWAARDTFPLEVDGPGQLDCSIYEQRSRLIIHIVNLSGCNRRGYCDELYPVGPISARVPLGGRNLKKGWTCVLEKEIPVVIEKDTCHFTVDKIVDHEVIVLE